MVRVVVVVVVVADVVVVVVADEVVVVVADVAKQNRTRLLLIYKSIIPEVYTLLLIKIIKKLNLRINT